VDAAYDSLLAKLIVSAATWPACVRKAQRALDATHIHGVNTNMPVLRAVLAHPDFSAGACDTQWLERQMEDLLARCRAMPALPSRVAAAPSASAAAAAPAPTAGTLLRKGDAWSLSLTPKNPAPAPDVQQPALSHLEITRVLRNEFPHALAADVRFTTPAAGSGEYTMRLSSTTASASATTSQHRRANPADASHVGIPFAGTLVEVLVNMGDAVKEGDVVCVVQQMKMELEVRSARSGVVTWVCEAEDGDEVGEGTLAAIVMPSSEARL
jgi:acetyl/propionyl-CoA carboxylase alpha subunit